MVGPGVAVLAPFQRCTRRIPHMLEDDKITRGRAPTLALDEESQSPIIETIRDMADGVTNVPCLT